ncbi:hypothetical protein [Pseudomonas sp. NPDC088444]|uniref:hypothetical protein n=1 Tax=Pseudomonas sp. NPDC088444 TaxID=3364456 RepID=UPI00384EB3D7
MPDNGESGEQAQGCYGRWTVKKAEKEEAGAVFQRAQASDEVSGGRVEWRTLARRNATGRLVTLILRVHPVDEGSEEVSLLIGDGY